MNASCEPAAAINRLGGDKELYGELVQGFLAELEGVYSRLEAAIADGDANVVHRCAHKFKGSAATCGAMGVAAVCADFEELAHSGDLAGAAKLLATFKAKMSEAACELARYRC